MSRVPNMATVTAALERSLQNCSLSHRQAAQPAPSDSHGAASNQHRSHLLQPSPTLDLNSHVSLPYHWEQCLDLKTGEIYYINWRNGMKAKEDPRFTTEDDQYSDDYCYCYSDDDDSSYDSEESSTESSNNNNNNNNKNLRTSMEGEQEEEEEEHVLVVAGCKSCLMYFMVPKHLEDCPKCSTGQLLHFDRSENEIP